MNGNLDTVADVNKTKVSMFGQAMTPGRVSKISKFSRPLWIVIYLLDIHNLFIVSFLNILVI